MLPDCVLVEILSRLPATKCAVRTSTLSKRWKQIWTLVPNLIFIHRGDPNADFVSLLDKTLTQRGIFKLKKLDIHCSYNNQFEPHVRNWIRYAINCNVEEINIDFWHTYPRGSRSFMLDECFFTSSYLTDLKLSYCRFNPAGAISWKKLLSLHISNANLDEDLIENILSGSPVLETLKLKDCRGYTRLNITSKSVKKLVFDGNMFSHNTIEINAPTIFSLTIKACLYLFKLSLINVSCLVEANLDYKFYGFLGRNPEENMLKQFFLNLSHVNEVKIGRRCLKTMSRLEAERFIFPSNLKICDVSSQLFKSDTDSLEISDPSDSDSD